MHVALILASSIAGAGLVLYVLHRLKYGGTEVSEDVSATEDPDAKETAQEECCGLHITCERDSLSPVFGNEIEYFDDEELDEYINFNVQDYSDEDIERFRDVLLTLRAEDIAPWVRSIQQRGIELPAEVKDELFIIVEESRASKQVNAVEV